MARMIALSTILLLACAAPDETCVPGASQACACTTGQTGAKVCADHGAGFGACECLSGIGSPGDATVGDPYADFTTSEGADTTAQPYLETDTDPVAFGAALIGSTQVRSLTLWNGGGGILAIDHMSLVGDAQFEVQYGGASWHPGDGDILEAPVMLSPGDTLVVTILFRPVEGGVATATLHLPTRSLEIQGAGVHLDPPVAVVSIDEGTDVTSQTLLHLRGDQSFAPTGAIGKWSWSVTQPPGSTSAFLPTDGSTNPTFHVSQPGTYVFSLVVQDETGAQSAPAEVVVKVSSQGGIGVEVQWVTPPHHPKLPNQGPQPSAYVALHFLHPYASGLDLDGDSQPDGWFDVPFDCFWANPTPNWGSFDPAVDDDPHLIEYHPSGGNAANLRLSIPESGKTYRVGVHLAYDPGNGPTLVTLRVYIHETLVWERSDVALVNHDMWDAVMIEWPTGDVKAVLNESGSLKITPSYEHPGYSLP